MTAQIIPFKLPPSRIDLEYKRAARIVHHHVSESLTEVLEMQPEVARAALGVIDKMVKQAFGCLDFDGLLKDAENNNAN